jgi:hypothetical protein
MFPEQLVSEDKGIPLIFNPYKMSEDLVNGACLTQRGGISNSQALQQEQTAIEKAFQKLGGRKPQNLDQLLMAKFVRNYGSTLEINFQNGTIKDVGLNGVQFTFLIEMALEIITELDKKFPCEENGDTINYLEAALKRQKDRTKDREERGVEGISKK